MNISFDQIIINVVNNNFTQIVFIKDCIILFVEPFESKHHNEYLNLDITEFQF
jgi:hypothetical protein